MVEIDILAANTLAVLTTVYTECVTLAVLLQTP